MSSVLIGNVVYDNLIYYMVALCTFIPAWVFLVLGWQILGKYNLRRSNNENK